MAEAEGSVAVHEHIEPNILNLLILAAVIILVVYGLKVGSHKYPKIFGGLSAV